MSTPFVVGLTGGIGCGKTTISNEFKRLGITIVDADEIAREIVAPGSECLGAIENKFGNDILQSDGHLNRAKLRRIVFADPNFTEWINALLHPKIRAKMLADIAASPSPYTILSIPLLFENKLQHLCNRVIVVDIPLEQQIQRVQARDQSDRQTIESIIAAQINRDERLALADDIIDNSGPQKNSVNKVLKLHEIYTKLTKFV